MARPFLLRSTRAHVRSWAVRAITLAVLVGAAGAVTLATGATSTTVVSADVPSATFLDVGGCAPLSPGITDFGVVQPGAVTRTSADCGVAFGSSNDTSSLRLAQSDGFGTAMAHPTDAWTRTTGASARLTDIAVGGGTGWALAASGAVRRSLDNGATWNTTAAIPSATGSAIAAPSTTVAWAAGNTASIYLTTTGTAGTPTWNPTTVAPGMASVRGVAASSATVAWVVGSNGDIRSTTTGGTTPWTTYTSPVTTSLAGIRMLDADSLVAWGANGTVVATSDGVTWRDISIPAGQSIRAVWQFTDAKLVAIGSSGTIYSTSNATNPSPTWSSYAVPTGDDFFDVAFADASNGIVVGRTGAMLTSADGGGTWTAGTLDTVNNIGAVATTGAGTYVAAGAGMDVLRTVDGGANWNHVIGGYLNAWTAAAMATDRTGWRVGSGGQIERTIDGGTSWTPQGSSTGADLLDVTAFDPNRAVAVGRGGTIVATTNGGTTWTTRPPVTTSDLRAVDAADDFVVWAAGDNGTIAGSADFGQTWTVRSTAPGVTLLDLTTQTRMIAVATGRSGYTMRTADGVTWTGVALPTGAVTTRTITSVPGTGPMLLNVGTGQVLRSSDGGASWTVLTPTATAYFNGMAISPTGLVFGGSDGVLLVSRDGGSTWSAANSGSVSFHWIADVDVVDRTTFVAVGDGNMSGVTGSTGAVTDYVQNVSDWYADGNDAFGACLRATSATPTWTVNATCDQSADGAHWRGIPTGTGVGSEVARTTGPGLATASFRFGLRVAPTQTPGELSAGLSFVLIAP